MISLAIQAGGQSLRMGREKALLDFQGQPLIQRVLKRVSYLADDIFITANNQEKYQFLDIRILPDIIPGIGALGGIFTALKYAKHPNVFVVACDLPFANPDLLSVCLRRQLVTNADVVIPQSKNGLEPLHAVYRRDTCLPAVEAAINTGKRRVISWHSDVNVHMIDQEEVSKFDPNGITFWNVNTPDEFQRALNKASELNDI
jgi:molybdopterin-guanine dinucleotide biosynthesis protein A